MTEKHFSRAGYYQKQPSGYQAFIPAPLPPKPALRVQEKLSILLSKADRELGRLDGATLTLPDPDLFVLMYKRKESVLSSRIEGTQSSLHDLLSAEAKIYNFMAQRGEIREVMNHVKAMNHGLERLPELPVSVRLIAEIHEKLMKGTRGGRERPGEIRHTQNWIGPDGCGLSEAAFVPPPAHVVGEALSEWEKFLHEKDTIPALLKIGLVHAQFETIHPFLDGNGRIGRLLITFLLAERKILQKPVLYLSSYFNSHKTEYYERLQDIRDSGDWEGWLLFFLQGIAEVCADANETARQINIMRENHQEKIINDLGRAAGNGLKVLKLLFSRPVISINQVAHDVGIGYITASQIVKELVRWAFSKKSPAGFVIGSFAMTLMWICFQSKRLEKSRLPALGRAE